MSDPMSPYGEPPRDVGGPRTAPRPVQNAVTLMFVRAGLSALGLLVLLSTRGALRDQFATADPRLTPGQLDAAISLAVTVGAVFGLVFVGLYVLLAVQVRKGVSWARTVTLVLAGVSVLTALLSLLQPAPTLSRGLGLLVLVIDVAILFLLSQPSAHFFRRAV